MNARENDVRRGILLSPLDGIHARTMSSIACYHLPWSAHTIGRHRAWQCYHRPLAAHMVGRRLTLDAIIAFGQHTRSNYVERGIPSSPLEITHDHTTSGVTCHHPFGQHTRTNDVEHRMSSSPLDTTYGLTIFVLACPYGPRAAHTV